MTATRSRADIIQRPRGHARILGAPRSGKTSLLVERFHHLVHSGHHPLVIAFGREQSDALLERLWPAGTAVFGPTPVTTHGLLATRILSAARPARARTLRDVDECVVIDRVIEKHSGLLRSDLRSIAGSSSFRDDLLRLLHVLAQNGVAPDDADRAAKRATDPRAGDVLRVSAAYQRHLAERGLVTFYDAAWEAARRVAEDSSLAAAAGVHDVVLVDDVQDLDAGQFALLRAIAPPDGAVALEVFGDPAGSRFSFRGTSDRFLLEELPSVYRPVDFRLTSPRPSQAALATVLDSLHASEASTTPMTTPAPAVTGLPALPLFATAPAVATEPDTVVAVAEWRVNVRAVRASDEVAEAQHAAACVRGWIEQGIAPDEIAIVARDPERVSALVQHAFRERGVPIAAGARADSATDAFVHALVGSLGRDSDGRFAEALEASPLMAPFCRACDLPRDAARVSATLRKAYSSRGGFDLARLLRENLGSLAATDVIERVTEEWIRYAEVVAHAGGDPSLDEFRHAYLAAAAQEEGDRRAPRLVSARAVSGRTMAAVIVMGCADGLFPRVEVDGGYLPMASLSAALAGVNDGAARDIGVRLDRARAEREESALLFSALACATEELCVSHPRKSGDQVLTIPAALSPLFASADDVVRDTSVAFTASTRVTRAAAGAGLSEAARAIEPMAGGWLAPPLAPRRPVFEKLALSPSRLDTYTNCERKFFFQRVLRIEDPSNIYLTIGRVFHDVLKELIPVGASGDEVRAALASDAADGIIDRVVAAAMPDTGEWVHTLTKVHMRRMLEGVRELESWREGKYRVLSVETASWFPDEENASLTGRLDRIDHVEGLGAVVIDYKTSRLLPKTAASILAGIEKERDYWQVVMYSALARALNHEVKAFVYYVVPPGEEVNAVGVQLMAGNLPHVIPGGGRYSRYDPMPAGLLQAVLDDAMEIHAHVLAGTSAYARTDHMEHCKNCLFIRACRRNAE